MADGLTRVLPQLTMVGPTRRASGAPGRCCAPTSAGISRRRFPMPGGVRAGVTGEANAGDPAGDPRGAARWSQSCHPCPRSLRQSTSPWTVPRNSAARRSSVRSPRGVPMTMRIRSSAACFIDAGSVPGKARFRRSGCRSLIGCSPSGVALIWPAQSRTSPGPGEAQEGCAQAVSSVALPAP